MDNNKTSKQIEKTIVTEILERLGLLLIADAPLKSKYQEHADKLRGQILTQADPVTRDAFLSSRKILSELARLLARCQDREQLAKALGYIQALNGGEVLIAENDPRESEMRQRLIAYCNQTLRITPWDQDITDIINIVRFVNQDPIH